MGESNVYEKKMEIKIEGLKKRKAKIEEQIEYLRLRIEDIEKELEKAEEEKETSVVKNFLKKIKEAGFDVTSRTMGALLENMNPKRNEEALLSEPEPNLDQKNSPKENS